MVIGVHLGSSNVFMTKLWGVLRALEMSWNAGFHQVHAECDSKVVISFIFQGVNVHHPYHVMMVAIPRFREIDWGAYVFACPLGS